MMVVVMRLGSVCVGDVLVRLEVVGVRCVILGGWKGVGYLGWVWFGVVVIWKLFFDFFL